MYFIIIDKGKKLGASNIHEFPEYNNFEKINKLHKITYIS